jgi:cell division protein FtsN
MKVSLTIGLLGIFALAACEVDEPPPRRVSQRPVAKYPQQQAPGQYPAQPQPFEEAGAAPQTAPPPATEQTTTTQETASAPAPAAPPTAKGDYPYGVPVPGKPGFVRSPYSPDKMTDVRGYAPGTEVKDPYTNKIFLVP